MTTKTLIKRISKIENEIFKIKKETPNLFLKTPISLRGILGQLKISEKDFKEAKKSVFRVRN